MTLSELSQAYLESTYRLEARIAELKNSREQEEDKIKALESMCDEERQLAKALKAYIERKENAET